MSTYPLLKPRQVPQKKWYYRLLVFITGFLIIFDLPLIYYLSKYIQTSAFALTGVPPMFAGWFLGVRGGFICGVVMGICAFCLMLYMGIPVPEAAMTVTLGAFFITTMGMVFGYLSTLASSASRERRDRIKAEQVQTRLEEQLQQSQKMEAIGTLAGGVAHDINNILGVIMSSASLIENDIEDSDRHRDSITDIITACRQGKALTQNLLGFARKGKYVKEIIDLKDVIENTKKLLERTIDKKIVIETDLPQGSLQIQGDRSQIDQAIMNICINSIESMTGRGKLTITSNSFTLNEFNNSELKNLKPGPHIKIALADTGIGMDTRTASRVFEPFFTTKGTGQGTGLGLSMVYGTIINHGGHVSIESKPGAGTCVNLIVPSVDCKQVQIRPSPSPSFNPGAGHILLVDDEDLYRNSCARLLRRLGYEVLVAKNGFEAIDLYSNSTDPISLVILDLIMPEIDGVETCVRLKELDSNVKVLISSGYGKDEKIESLLANGAVGFIQKPFEMSQIASSISKALDLNAAKTESYS